jgi:signal transduction histidine kinase
VVLASTAALVLAFGAVQARTLLPKRASANNRRQEVMYEAEIPASRRRAMRPRAAFWYACVSWVLSLGVLATGLAYNAVYPLPGDQQGNAADGVAAALFIGGFATVGALLMWKRPGNVIGWLLSACGLAYAAGAATLLLSHVRSAQGWLNWFGWIWFLGIGLAVFVVLLFPTGRLPSRRWRPVAWFAGAGVAAWVLGNAFASSIFTQSPQDRNPIGAPGLAGHIFFVLAHVGAVLIVGGGLAAIVSVVFRYRRAGTVEREQLKWLVYAGALIVVILLAALVLDKIMRPGNASNNLQNALGTGAVALIPVAIGIAIFRYRLYDIDVVINKTLVYGSLAAFITAVYVAIVVGLGSLVAGHGARPSLALSIAATAVVAVAFQPARARAQHLANRLVYGRRATPYEVLAEFAERTAGTYATEELLPRMARILAEGTGASRADVWLRAGEAFRDDATWPPGEPQLGETRVDADGRLTVPGADQALLVHHQDEVLGALSVCKRPGESLAPAEGKLLADLAAQAGLVLRNVGLWEQLTDRLEEIRVSRQRLVAAQDAERRRIERNIHDGAQQQLVALAIKLSLTEGLIGTDPEGERELLAELRKEAVAAVEDLRDLARGIYPPLLAGEGLAAALQAQAAKSPVRTSVDAGEIGRYPQDVEAAVYFCVLEALQNVAKYAGAGGARVRLEASGDELRFEVADDGAGFDPGTKAFGTGLQGMADRLSAHDGALDVRSSPGAGTVVTGRIRVRVPEAVR